MKLKNHYLMDPVSIEALKFFSKLHIPLTVSYKLNKCLEVMQSELNSLNKAKEDLIMKLGVIKKNEQGEIVGYNISEAPVENKKEFLHEMEELLKLDFEVPVDEKIKVSISKLGDEVKISSEFVNKLMNLVEFVD